MMMMLLAAEPFFVVESRVCAFVNGSLLVARSLTLSKIVSSSGPWCLTFTSDFFGQTVRSVRRSCPWPGVPHAQPNF